MEQRKSQITWRESTVTIRAYRSSDLVPIVQLWYDTWHQTFPHLKHPHPYSVWKKRFQDELVQSGSIWLAEMSTKIVGFIVVLPEQQMIDQFFVDMNYQSQGIGAMLLQQAKLICPQGLSLYTLQENRRARSFYERHGFQPGHCSVNTFNLQPNIEYHWTP
jgi:ribosomal protein S18 acetylase RimI-like enzyme